MHAPQFSEHEQERYQRHLQLPAFGPQAQARCRQAHVAIIGMGGLGCPVSLYLAAAGIGTLTLVDGDTVSLSNLQRQILFTESDIGTNKAEAAKSHLAARNSHIKVISHASKLTADNAESILKDADMVIDCSDNFYARYLINDTCFARQTPWIYSSVLGQQGQVALFQPQHSCFRCLFPKLDSVPDCNQAGVLGVMPGMLGTMQASLALQYLTGYQLPTHNELQLVTSWPFSLRTIRLAQSNDCQLCHRAATSADLAQAYEDASQPLGPQHLLSIDQFKLHRHRYELIDVRDANEHANGNMGGKNIPLPYVEDSFVPEANGHYLFYCQTGKRSAAAVQKILTKYEHTMFDCQLYSLAKGLNN